ncbi:MAG: AMP-binding protein, partial [Pyramidobacter sp.]|nr:AMP-binding protein [Pyramidobacter sp.]
MEIIRWLEEANAQSLVFSDENSSMTYGDFRASAKRIGSALIAHFNVTKKPIVVFIDRNVQSICALFGVIYSGNFYVPIDLSQPVDRIRGMFELIHPIAVIKVSESAEVEKELSGYCPLFSYESLA